MTRRHVPSFGQIIPVEVLPHKSTLSLSARPLCTADMEAIELLYLPRKPLVPFPIEVAMDVRASSSSIPTFQMLPVLRIQSSTSKSQVKS